MASIASCMASTFRPQKLVETERSATVTAYTGMAVATVIIMLQITEFDFSAVQTVSAGCMLLAFLLLSIKVNSQGSAAGVSSRMLEMYLLSFILRLGSTLLKKGYLPIDATGNFVYQTFEISTVGVILRLVYSLHRDYKTTYEPERDLHSIYNVVPLCVLVAMLFHANLNRSFVFDSLWMTAHVLETFALLPQLYMITQSASGKVETYTAHFVALMFCSRVFSWLFWWYGYPELADGYVENVTAGNFNWGGYTIMIASTLQLLLSADFMCHYLKSRFFCKPMDLGEPLDV